MPFEEGDRVWIDKSGLRNFPNLPHSKWARIKRAGYGVYALDVDGMGWHAWYPEQALQKERIKEMSEEVLQRPPKEAHVQFHFKGNGEKVELFHWLASKMDPDYPYRPELQWKPTAHCGICEGAIYRMPNLTAGNLRSLAQQIDNTNRIPGGLKLKIKKYSVQTRCSKNDPPVDPEEEEVPTAVVTADLNIYDAANEVD
ncbi:MAG: hypothetical protein KGI27_10110 [Thaumarchaeota archaeon]|nr:hypothetical protein [Nitrososphaerota archaeon]